MSPVSYYLAGVGPAGRTVPQEYPSLEIARNAVIRELRQLAERFPDEMHVLDRAVELVEADDQGTHLDYMTLHKRSYVIFYGPR